MFFLGNHKFEVQNNHNHAEKEGSDHAEQKNLKELSVEPARRNVDLFTVPLEHSIVHQLADHVLQCATCPEDLPDLPDFENEEREVYSV